MIEIKISIEAALRKLLEERHVYQSITIEPKAIIETLSANSKRTPPLSEHERELLLALLSNRWSIKDKAERGLPSGRGAVGLQEFAAPDAKLYCQACGRLEAFNPVSSIEFLERGVNNASHQERGGVVQVFVLSFLCQSCRKTPEVFLVRREGLKLTFSGRAPQEYIDVPSVIPKKLQARYRSALIARDTGFTLAGLLYLRVVIEQWVLQWGHKPAQRADDLLNAYAGTLPEDFRSRFPSLTDIYKRLSEALHEARDDEDLFEDARGKIERHFDARRLHELPPP